jgi:hypothetical protein
MNNDCCWCGDGNGICDDCMSNMFAQSSEIAATGTHLASTLYGSNQEEQTENEGQS